MKTLCFILFFFCSIYSQAQITTEKIPKGFECTGCVIETEISQDTIWVSNKQYDNENHDIIIITNEDIYIENDTVKLTKPIWYISGTYFVKGKWTDLFPKDKYWQNYIKAFPKSIKAVQQWQIAVIKRKFPDYYNKYFVKKR